MPQASTIEAISPETAHASKVLTDTSPPLASARQGGLDLEARLDRDTVWLIMRRNGDGGLALRMPVFSDDAKPRVLKVAGALLALECKGTLGTAHLVVTGEPFGLDQLRATLQFKPAQDLAIDWVPRDLVPFNARGEAQATTGNIEAHQRKMNTGLLYFTLQEPAFGKVLYLQNLTALNDYFNATGSNPGEAVTGRWPDLGYQLPRNPETERAVLPKGQDLTLYDTILSVRGYPQTGETDSAWQFLDMLGAVYHSLNPPEPGYHDWVNRAQRTVADLESAPDTRIRHYGHTYFHPYTASEYPDSMVQLSIASALLDWGQWNKEEHPLVREIVAGLGKFYDPKLKTLRRYLPNVGEDKNANAVDSWYLYHPMLNLSNLALAGNEKARELFLDSIEFGIKAAHHFEYKWPIMYDVTDFSVITDVAEADDRGQTDVGGIYAWVMLQAFELTHERRFLDEAENAIAAAQGMRFDLNYQANLTAWGAAACIRLWRITDRDEHLHQSYVYLASFFHNCQIWKSDIGLSRHWTNFLGVTCLQDAPYMAAYECFDSFAAFERYLDYVGADIIPGVKLLVNEFCRYALDRAWFFYPDALPEEALATENRNGHIDPKLNFPVEDLYPDGQKNGQVGQEIYGAGAALIYATRAFHRLDDAPFLLFCDSFVRAMHRLDSHTLNLRVDGHETTPVRLALLPLDGKGKTLQLKLWTANREELEITQVDGRYETWAPSNNSLLLSWKDEAR
ncbi:hypothetical protein [Novosphingobium sp. 9U]|uniref:hypothetical protein n=1 Tax=Novosphingobium sp. 9U TaxID=2653158 RepID=UPI0012F2193F|nr:hypothetical protein [Novosphingobium sp. 9U]VWX55135.1 conserved hypothetical protein [Novosphingobium sp. 9U]